MTDHQKSDTDVTGLGPLAGLIGVWEGNEGVDVSPGLPDRKLTDTETSYHERWAFELVSPAVENHDQKLRQLTFATNARRGVRPPQGIRLASPSMGSSVT